VRLAKLKPGELNFGSSGAGGFPHLSGELFKTITGTNLTHVPYKGSTQAVSDLVGGQIQVLFDYLPSTLPMVKAGKLRALGVASKERSPAAPEIPTAAEAGVPNYRVTSWFGILAPAKTPRPIIDQYHKEILRIVAAPEMVRRFREQGAEVFTSTPEEFAALIKSDTAHWGDVIRTANVKVE
jgi:tripartite-type tricarboxylate transporter receptor subunit TctC